MSIESQNHFESLENQDRAWQRVTETLKDVVESTSKSRKNALLALATVMALAPNEGSAQSADVPIESLSLEQNYTLGSDTYFEDRSLELSYTRASELAYELQQEGMDVDINNLNVVFEGYVPVEVNGNSTWDLLTDVEQERVEHIREIGKIMSGETLPEISIEDQPDVEPELSEDEPGIMFESEGSNLDAL